jgi:hypothetical protein
MNPIIPAAEESEDDDDSDDDVARAMFAAAINFCQQVEEMNQVIPALLEQVNDDSDDDEARAWGGSLPGKAPNKARDFQGAYARLVQNYFSGVHSKYDENDFERRFRMPRHVFNRIYEALLGQEPFLQKYDAVGKPGINPLVRVVACMRKLAIGPADDALDENFEISESQLNIDVKAFARLIKLNFGQQYMNRQPSEQEIERSFKVGTIRGFPGAFASWDCKHFKWDKCPVALQGQYRGKEGDETIVLEAICDHDLYVWYHFFGTAGSLNDINILHRSPIVSSILSERFPIKAPWRYQLDNNERDWMYFLVDGIYPRWAIFVNGVRQPLTEQEQYFTKCQEAIRKDIERCFGVIVSKFHILKNPVRYWHLPDICDILDCCVILHNMVVEARRDATAFDDNAFQAAVDIYANGPAANIPRISLFGQNANALQEEVANEDEMIRFQRLGRLHDSIHDVQAHLSLKADLTEHMWRRRDHFNN